MIERALVVGAGIGGLATAAGLAQRGVAVDVVEIKPANTVYGVGINQPSNALRALKALGLLDEIVEHGFIYDRVRFCDLNGNLFAEIPHGTTGGGVPPNCALPRRELARILLDAARRAGADVRFGCTAKVAPEGANIAVVLDDGTATEYPLVAAFDGIRSSVRRDVLGATHEPVSTGYGAWRVTVPRPPEVTCPSVFQGYGTKAGYIPLTKETMYMLAVTPAPPGLHYEPDRLVEHLAAALDGYGGPIAELRAGLRPGDDVVYGVMEQVFLPRPWHSGGVVVAGDAAHACAPHLTQGAAMALEDAVVIGECISETDDVDEALARFEDRRYERARFVQDASLAILAGESLVTDPETLAVHARFCAEVLPGQIGAVDEYLSQPA